MKVNIPDKVDKVVAGEMVGGSGELGIVAEMLTDPAKLEEMIPVQGLGERAAALATAVGDDSPQFPVVRVEEGWSKSGRLWNSNTLESIVRQTNELEPVGHLGHIPDDEAATSMPDVQTTWLGAVIKKEPSQQKDRVGEMVSVAYFGGYNHPGAKIRMYLKTKAVRGISWWGRARQVPIPGRGVEMKDFDLESIDWARKLAEGMPTSRVVAIAREMKEDEVGEVDLAQVTPEQFKKENPNGYALLVKEVEDQHATVVGEMEAKIETGDKAQSLIGQVFQALGLKEGDNLIEEITKLKEKVGAKAATMVKTALDALLEEKIPDEEKRKLVARLLPVGEMTTAAETADDNEGVKKLVGEMVEKYFNDDDMIKQIVSEQSAPVIRRAEDLRRAAGNGLENNEYVQRESRLVGA